VKLFFGAGAPARDDVSRAEEERRARRREGAKMAAKEKQKTSDGGILLAIFRRPASIRALPLRGFLRVFASSRSPFSFSATRVALRCASDFSKGSHAGHQASARVDHS
jgi:hypothetical protein